MYVCKNLCNATVQCAYLFVRLFRLVEYFDDRLVCTSFKIWKVGRWSMNIAYIPCVIFLFVSMWWDHVSELWPPASLLLIPQVIYEHGATEEWYWQGKTKKSEKTRVHCRIVRPRICGERSATKRPSNWTALFFMLTLCFTGSIWQSSLILTTVSVN